MIAQLQNLYASQPLVVSAITLVLFWVFVSRLTPMMRWVAAIVFPMMLNYVVGQRVAGMALLLYIAIVFYLNQRSENFSDFLGMQPRRDTLNVTMRQGPGYNSTGTPCMSDGVTSECAEMILPPSREMGALPTYEIDNEGNRPILYELSAINSNLPEPLPSLPDENVASLGEEWPAVPPIYADYSMYDNPDRLDSMSPIPENAGRPQMPDVGMGGGCVSGSCMSGNQVAKKQESLLDRLSNLLA